MCGFVSYEIFWLSYVNLIPKWQAFCVHGEVYVESNTIVVDRKASSAERDRQCKQSCRNGSHLLALCV
jgi:hypothetical protein